MKEEFFFEYVFVWLCEKSVFFVVTNGRRDGRVGIFRYDLNMNFLICGLVLVGIWCYVVVFFFV